MEEERNFCVGGTRVKGFYKEVLWGDKENSFYLSVVSCLFDFLLRFSGREELKPIVNAFEYDLKTACKAGFDLEGVSRLEGFLGAYEELRKLGGDENLEGFYGKLEGDKGFVRGMAEWSSATLKRNRVIKDYLDVGDLQQVLVFFYKRFRICVAVYKDGDWVRTNWEAGFAIFCPMVYGDGEGFGRLLTREVYRGLKVGTTEIKFPYVFKLDWESVLGNAVEDLEIEEEQEQVEVEGNEKLLNLLTQIILQVPLDPEEQTQILSEYSKSGLFSKDLELLKLRNAIRPNPLTYPTSLTAQCDECKSTCPSKILISCKSHSLCTNCRLSSFAFTYSSTCSICDRPLTTKELTILNSYI